ncbi:hypothetical protein D3C80_1433830 [compost metagenome]
MNTVFLFQRGQCLLGGTHQARILAFNFLQQCVIDTNLKTTAFYRRGQMGEQLADQILFTAKSHAGNLLEALDHIFNRCH